MRLAYYNRANCKANMDDYGAGISDMDDAIKIEPKNASFYKQRGNFHYQLTDRKKPASIGARQLNMVMRKRVSRLISTASNLNHRFYHFPF